MFLPPELYTGVIQELMTIKTHTTLIIIIIIVNKIIKIIIIIIIIRISLFYGDNILSIHLSNIWSSDTLRQYNYVLTLYVLPSKSNRKAMNRNWSNQKANPSLKTKAGNK